MTTFRLDTSNGPGTHVFVVGVGGYDYLLDGSEDPIEDNGGMGQLTSCPISAMAMLKWFDTEMSNLRVPLKSIEVLVSSSAGDLEYKDSTGNQSAIKRATYDNFEDSAQLWFDRANSNPDNNAVFYFCGHGLDDGVNSQLLLSDYGKSSNPLRHAVSFNAFRMAMNGCAAMNQIFFVDACRVRNSKLLIEPNKNINCGIRKANVTKMFRGSNPAFFSARIGDQAFGDPNKVSDFTAALLASLTKYGARRNKWSEWAISPSQLQIAIAALMDDFSGAKQCETDGLSGAGFDLHVLSQLPETLLHISVAPSHHHELAQLRACCGDKVQLRENSEHPWRTSLPVGESEVSATFLEETGISKICQNVPLVPPLQQIELAVQ